MVTVFPIRPFVSTAAGDGKPSRVPDLSQQTPGET